MLELTVKTLEGRNRSFCVPDDITVKNFKDKIAGSIEIPADRQRLIFQGRVLQDDKPLNDYDVNGKTIHVVQRVPPSSRPQSNGASNTGGRRPAGSSGSPSDEQSFVLGSFSLPSDVVDPNQVQNIVQQVLSGMGGVGRNARVSTQSSGDGSSVDVHINLGHVGPAPMESEASLRLHQVRQMLDGAREALGRLERVVAGEPEDPPSDMDTSSPVREAEASPSPPLAADSPTSESSSTPPSSADNTEATTGDGTGSTETGREGATSRIQHPPLSDMGSLLTEVQEVNTRLQPFIDQFRDSLNADVEYSDEEASGRAHRVARLVSEAMHYVSHAYHSVSDCMVDFSRPPPRQVHANPPPAQHHMAVIQHTIPVQAQINVAHISPSQSPSLRRRNAPGGSTTASSTPPSSTTSTSTSSSSSSTSTTTSGSSTRVPLGPQVRFGPPPPPGHPAAVPPGGAQGPYMFMDFGPPGVGINTMTSNVVGGPAATPPTTATGTAGTQTTAPPPGAPRPPAARPPFPPGMPFMPPDFLQNIATLASTAAMQAHNVRMPPMAPPPQQRPQGTAPQPPPSGTTPRPPPAGIHGAPRPPNFAQGMPPFMPPDMLQNIISMATQNAMQGGQPGQQVFVISNGQTVPTQGVPLAANFRPPFPPGVPPRTAPPPQTAAPPPASGQPASSIPTPPASSTTTTTASGTASQNTTTGSSNGQPPRGAAFMFPGPLPGAIPGMPPGMMPPGFGGPPPVDPFLQCQSHHFLVRAAANAANAATAATTAGAPQAATANSNQAPEQSLSNMMSSIVSGLVNQPSGGQPPAGGAPSSTPASSINTSATSSTPAATPATGASPHTVPVGYPLHSLLAGAFQVPPNPAGAVGSGAATSTGSEATNEPAYVAQLRNILQQGNVPRQPANDSATSTAAPAPTTAGTTTSSSTTSESGAPAQQGVSDEVFAQLVRGIGSFVSRAALGQQPNESIADFLNNLGQEHNISQGEGLLTDLFNSMASHLTFVDLMSVFFGHPEPLNRVREPLQAFMREKVLQGNEATDTNIEQTVERVLLDAQPDIEATCADVTAVEDIDFQATLNMFFRHHMISVITWLMHVTGDQDSFAQELYDRVRQIMHDFVALSRECLQGGDEAVHTMVQSRVRAISMDTNPMIQQWMVSMSTQQVAQVLPGVGPVSDDVKAHIVRRGQMDTDGSSDASFMSADDDSVASVTRDNEGGATEPVVPDHDAMDVDSEERIPREAGARPLTLGLDPSLLQNLPPPPRPEPHRIEVVVGSEDWHSQVSQEWVEVITRDIHRQRHQTPDQPHSDAYLSGMPAKRRKTMKGGDGELSNTQAVLPVLLQRAAEDAGVQPTTSVAAMTRAAETQRSLHTAFHRQVEKSVGQKLEKDPNYTPSHFPCSHKYFKK